MRRGHEQADDQSRFQKSEDTTNWPDTCIKQKEERKKTRAIEIKTRLDLTSSFAMIFFIKQFY